MSLISVQNLTFSYDGGYKPVFENVSFMIDTDWKLGFVGRNGRGKTTFLKLLEGKLEYRGSISSNVKFTYFPYAVKECERLAYEIMGEVCPEAEEWRIVRELSYLNMDAGCLYMPFSSLSNGERTKLLLAGMFLSEGDFLLIDEPTNHLDAEARRVVADYLKGKKGFILVSHDREFLDGCVDHILSVNRTDIEVQSGNFSSWFENFGKKQAFELARNEKLKKDIARLDASAKRTAGWAEKTEASKYGKTSAGLKPDRGYVGHKSAKMMKRAKSVEDRQERAIAQKSELLQNTETSERLKLFPLQYRAERLAEFKSVQVFYGERCVCAPADFEILRGERVFLDGRNGCGKSSLLKILAGESIAHKGIVSVGSGLIISYVPQSAEGLSGSLTDFASASGIDGSLFRAVLDKMDFTDFGAELSRLSEGQKKKILIARSLCERAHLYVWDEPLNYIDIYSRMQIENLICDFQPTMILVEHDRAFQKSIATKIIKI